MISANSSHKTNIVTAHWQWSVANQTVRISDNFFTFIDAQPPTDPLVLDNWISMFENESQASIAESFQRLASGQENSLDFSAVLRTDSKRKKIARGSGHTIQTGKSGAALQVAGDLQLGEEVQNQEPGSPEEAHLFNQLMEHLPYSIYFKDSDSRFLKISRDCARKFGLSDPDEATGKTDFDFFDEQHASEAYRDEQHILTSGRPVIGKIEKENVPGDSSRIQWASSTKLPLYDNQDNIVGTFGITNNVTERIDAQQALKRSEEKYRSIFEHIQDVYYRTDPDGLVTEISPSIERYSGYKRGDIIGKPVADFYYSSVDYEDLISQLKKNGTVSDFEIRLANARNCVVHTSISSKVIRDKQGNPVGVEGIMRDISERKLAEDKLQETHNFYTQILSNTSQGLYVVNQDLEYVFWNKTMEAISGYSESYVLGKNPADLFAHVGNNDIVQSIKKALSGQTHTSGDYFYKIEDTGKSGWVQAFYTPLTDKHGSLHCALVAITDVTERKAAEDKLRLGDETLKKLSEQLPGAIYQYQQYPDGSARFPFASTAFEHIYELNPDDVKRDARPALERILPEDYDAVVRAIHNSFQTMENWEQDYRVDLPERGLRWLRGRARPEKKPDGSVIWHGYITDITEEKMRQTELSDTLDIVSEQNSRLMNFAHIVSHNLRNHAGNISSLLSLYESEESEESRTQLLSYLNMASERLNEAIHDLNEIIDQQAGSETSIKTLNVVDYFKKIKEILSTDIINHSVVFKTSIPDDIDIEYNPAYLESILLNLISNAIKYRAPDRRPVITIRLEVKNGDPILTIKDNGLGIDLDKHGEKLFGMYNTFHSNDNSKGIGLYITKNQVESMGGTIEVESEIDKGTTFRVNLSCAHHMAGNGMS